MTIVQGDDKISVRLAVDRKSSKLHNSKISFLLWNPVRPKNLTE